MPGMSGMQLAARTKEDANYDILLIMLSGISNRQQDHYKAERYPTVLAKSGGYGNLKTILLMNWRSGKGDSPHQPAVERSAAPAERISCILVAGRQQHLH
jgi:CheY-like chemotaxis protein